MARILGGFLALLFALAGPLAAEPWRRHTIDDSSRGADGVRLADANGDGRLDIATGWEQGGIVRVYLQPSAGEVRNRWPSVTVGQVGSPEDAVFVDLDRDGQLDVVSCCEGQVRTVFVHWAPSDRRQYLESAAWKTVAIPATRKRESWMYALPRQIDGRHGPALLIGSKGSGASVSWLETPADPRKVEDWKLHRLVSAGWIMSLAAHDFSGDGHLDVVVSDRKGPQAGVYWLQHPGLKDVAGDWSRHPIGGDGLEVMFLDVGRLDGDALADVLVATRNKKMLAFYQQKADPPGWRSVEIANPFGVPHGKAALIADLNGDGRVDIVHDANTHGDRSHPGVAWLERTDDGSWRIHDISGTEGVKFDLLEAVDLDGDGDLDLIGCEEADNLGVFWYENPLR